MLMVGMFTEAFLFLIGTLEHPHPEFHWENVFPQLLEYGTKPELSEEKSHQPRPTLLGAGIAGEATAAVAGMNASGAAHQPRPTLLGAGIAGEATAAVAGMNASGAAAPAASAVSAKVPSLKEEDLKSLKDGIADLAKTASQLSELNKVAATGVKLNDRLVAAEAATMEYTSKITAVGLSTDSLTKATEGLSGSYAQIGEDIKAVAEETKAYKQGVELVGKNIASLNSVYELQLQAVNAQVEAQKNAAASAKEAAEAQLAFANGTKQLQKHVADLNAIYGNMLNALA